MSADLAAMGARLREERKRLGFERQADFAALGGLADRSTLSNYELGKRPPDGAYLANIAEAGADILYIVTGKRGEGNTSEANDEVSRRLLDIEDVAIRGEALDGDLRAELAAAAKNEGLSERTRAWADRILIGQGDKDAAKRMGKREAAREEAFDRARRRLDAACADMDWRPPAPLAAALVSLLADHPIEDALLTRLLVGMHALSE